MVSPDSQAIACPLSGRNSTYRPVQISGTGSDINELYGGLRAFLFPVGAISRAASASFSLSISPRESSSITLVKISVTYSPTFSARASSPPGDQLTGKNILLTCRNRHPPRDWEGAGCRGRLSGELLIRVRHVR